MNEFTDDEVIKRVAQSLRENSAEFQSVGASENNAPVHTLSPDVAFTVTTAIAEPGAPESHGEPRPASETKTAVVGKPANSSRR